MRKGDMNFTVDDIEMFIEIGQVGLHSTANDTTLWLHSGLSESEEVISLPSAVALICVLYCCSILSCTVLLFNELLASEAIVLIVWSILHC